MEKDSIVKLTSRLIVFLSNVQKAACPEEEFFSNSNNKLKNYAYKIWPLKILLLSSERALSVALGSRMF